MISNPPPVSAQWTAAERLSYLTWMLGMTLEAINNDDHTVPILAKAATRQLIHGALAVASWSPPRLEANRENLMKPYDPAGKYHSVLLPPEWMDALRRLAATPATEEDVEE